MHLPHCEIERSRAVVQEGAQVLLFAAVGGSVLFEDAAIALVFSGAESRGARSLLRLSLDDHKSAATTASAFSAASVIDKDFTTATTAVSTTHIALDVDFASRRSWSRIGVPNVHV